MVVGFTTTYAITAYHHWCCEFESRSVRGVQHYVIKCVNDLWQVCGLLRVFRLPPLIEVTPRYNCNIGKSGVKHPQTKTTRCHCTGKVWRYQRGHQKPYIEDGQTTQKKNDKGFPWRVSRFCSTCDTHRLTIRWHERKIQTDIVCFKIPISYCNYIRFLDLFWYIIVLLLACLSNLLHFCNSFKHHGQGG